MSSVQLIGHVTLINGFDLPNFSGCYALVTLRDPPANTVAVLTSEHKLQTLLETALSTGYQISVHGIQLINPPHPVGGTWDPGIEVYGIDQVTLYNTQ
jgi:hypothetical protein